MWSAPPSRPAVRCGRFSPPALPRPPSPLRRVVAVTSSSFLFRPVLTEPVLIMAASEPVRARLAVPSLLCSTPWAASCSPPRPADGPPALHSGDSPCPLPQRSACSALAGALVRTAHSRRSDTRPAGGAGVCRLARRPLPCCSSASPPARRGSHWETWGAVPLPFTPVPPLGVPSCGRACWHLAGHPAWCGHTC